MKNCAPDGAQFLNVRISSALLVLLQQHGHALGARSAAEDEHRVVEVLQKNGIPLCFEARAKGTAPSELLDAIGLGGTTRVLTAGLLPRANVPAVFGAINKALSYHKRGAGIAVTLPLTGVQNSILQLTAPADCAGPTAEKEEHTMKDHPYALLWVSVKAGHGDEAVDAARKAGARGGTVLKGNRCSTEEASSFLGISIREEQDFVMIVVPQEQKSAVMQAVTAACGLNTPAHGVTAALPVDEVMGLE